MVYVWVPGASPKSYAVTISDYRDELPQRTATLIGMVEAVAAEIGVQLR